MLGIVISGFPGIGKSTLSRKYANVLDLESSDYKWIYDNPHIESLDKESRKGIKSRSVNPEWPNNYITAVLNNLRHYDSVLVSTGKEVREALARRRIEYIVAFPDKFDKHEYLNRYKSRGNNSDFISLIESNFENWIDELQNEKSKICLASNEFLEDALIRLGYLTPNTKTNNFN